MEKKTTFAVIKTGGKQYKVTEGDTLKIESIPGAKEKLEFDDILNGQKVTAKKIGTGKADKVRVLKFRAKKRYKKITGHRQEYLEIQIEKIS